MAFTPEETYESIGVKIRTHIQSYVTEFSRKVVLDNETYDPDPMEIWLRISIKYSDTEPATLGKQPNRIVRRFGGLLIQIFTPSGAGKRPSERILTELDEHFLLKTVDSIQYKSPRVTDRSDGDFYQVNVTIPFHIDYKG